MADTETKSELLKEVLAPADSIREDLVTTAVKFLQNPKVHQSPLSQKKAFLQRKGLTAEEIDVAVGRAGVQSGPEVIAGSQDVASVQQGPGPVVAVKGPDVSKWVKARDIMAVITMVTGISYAAYKLYKEILVPWLFGLQTKDQRIENLERIVTDSMTNVNKTLSSIEETLGKQQEKLQILSHDVNSQTGGTSIDVMQNSSSINEIKTELSSIKGLLLNRRQFPPVPATTPILPSWQLASKSGDADSNNKGNDETTVTTETTNTVTLSSSPALENPAEIIAKDTDNDEASAQEAVIAAKNRTDLDSVQEEADTVQREPEGQASDRQVTEDTNDSEENEILD